MLDIKFVIENKTKVIEDLKKRYEFDLIPLVDEIINHYKKYIELKRKLDMLRHEKNEISLRINKLKKEGKEIKDLIKKMRSLSKKIKEFEEETDKEYNAYVEKLSLLPNITHPSVPKGTDEKNNIVIKEIGKPQEFKFKPLDHIEIFENRGWFDIERAGKVAGARFYYLKNEAVLLEYAIIQYALDFLIKKGFTLMTVPMLVREFAFFGTGFLPYGKNDLYKIENEDYYLIGTGEVSLGAYHSNETLLKEDLPLRYAAISSCFRTEAGSHGRDTKGIFRVHQFEKVEMFSYSLPENSWDEHEFLLKIAEEFYRSLELPYRVVNICSGDLGWAAAKKYDIEVYLPGQGKYREVVSCSNTTDYQSRRLNIKYREREGGKPKGYVHTLNSTLTALQRTMIAIVENYQNEDLTITVPKVLQPYLRRDVL